MGGRACCNESGQPPTAVAPLHFRVRDCGGTGLISLASRAAAASAVASPTCCPSGSRRGPSLSTSPPSAAPGHGEATAPRTPADARPEGGEGSPNGQPAPRRAGHRDARVP
eukprot:5752454-Pyramimonas_sp.AAC.1